MSYITCKKVKPHTGIILQWKKQNLQPDLKTDCGSFAISPDHKMYLVFCSERETRERHSNKGRLCKIPKNLWGTISM